MKEKIYKVKYYENSNFNSEKSFEFSHLDDAIAKYFEYTKAGDLLIDLGFINNYSCRLITYTKR